MKYTLSVTALALFLVITFFTPVVQHFLEQDSCLDNGDVWDELERKCYDVDVDRYTTGINLVERFTCIERDSLVVTFDDALKIIRDKNVLPLTDKEKSLLFSDSSNWDKMHQMYPMCSISLEKDRAGLVVFMDSGFQGSSGIKLLCWHKNASRVVDEIEIASSFGDGTEGSSLSSTVKKSGMDGASRIKTRLFEYWEGDSDEILAIRVEKITNVEYKFERARFVQITSTADSVVYQVN